VNNDEPPLITPSWARFLIPPAIILFAGAGLGIIGLGFSAGSNERDKAMFLIPIFLTLGGFFLYLGWRGMELLQYKMTRAEIREGQLRIKRNRHSSLESYNLDRLRVVDHRSVQILYIFDAESGRKLFAADYYYPRARAIASEVLARTRNGAKTGA